MFFLCGFMCERLCLRLREASEREIMSQFVWVSLWLINCWSYVREWVCSVVKGTYGYMEYTQFPLTCIINKMQRAGQLSGPWHPCWSWSYRASRVSLLIGLACQIRRCGCLDWQIDQGNYPLLWPAVASLLSVWLGPWRTRWKSLFWK